MNFDSIATICVKTRYEGLHHWPAAPTEVAFLRHKHRHIFHVELSLPVAHDDRALEFFLVRKQLDTEVGTLFEALGDLGSQSCEMMARSLAERMLVHYGLPWAECIVSEDGENSAKVIVSRAN